MGGKFSPRTRVDLRLSEVTSRIRGRGFVAADKGDLAYAPRNLIENKVRQL